MRGYGSFTSGCRTPRPGARRTPGAGPTSSRSPRAWASKASRFFPGGVVTDADGRFRIEGLGRDVMTLLEVVGPKVAYKRFRVISRAKGPIASEPRESGSDSLILTTNFGASCIGPRRADTADRRDRPGHRNQRADPGRRRDRASTIGFGVRHRWPDPDGNRQGGSLSASRAAEGGRRRTPPCRVPADRSSLFRHRRHRWCRPRLGSSP